MLLAAALPLIVLPLSIATYTVIESYICNQYKQLEIADYCDYPERFEFYRGVPTNFYRFVGSYLGRDEGTSTSLRNSLRSDVRTTAVGIAEVSRSTARGYVLVLDIFAFISLVVFIISVITSCYVVIEVIKLKKKALNE